MFRQLATIAVLTFTATTLAGCGTDDKPLTIDEMKEIFADKIPPSYPSPSPNTMPANDTSTCAHADTAMADVPTRGTTEPRLRLPELDGWNRFTQLDSELIRYALANPSLTDHDFAPNIVLTIEPAPSDNAKVVFAQSRSNLAKMAGATDMTSDTATVCGLPAERMRFQTPSMNGSKPGQHVQSLQVLATSGGRPYLVTATVQTKDPDNATYQHDAELLLAGLQVLAPTDS